MKRFFLLIVFIFSFFLLNASSVHAQEKIDEFNVNISLVQDSSFVVTEEIVYNFGSEQRHGIHRDIPYSYQRSGSKYNVRFKVLSVVNEEGKAWPYTVRKLGGKMKVKIGDSEVYVTGIKTYRLTYEVKRAINYFDDHDELYWNVTGDEWLVSITSATATITLPRAVKEDDIQLACYTGSFGSTDQVCSSEIVSDTEISFTTDDKLFTYEGLTIIIGLPKGVLIKPGTWQQVQWFLIDNWSIAIPIIVLFSMFYLWYSRGRDPRVRSTVIPYYEPPDKMPVGELGTIIDEKADLKDISATIIQLAIKGYLKIKEIEKKKLFGKDRDYELIKLKEADKHLQEYEKKIFKGMFDVGKTRTVSSMKNKFYVHLKKIKKALYELVVLDGYFFTNPEKVRQKYAILAALVIPIGVIILFVLGNVVAGISTALAGVIAIVFSRYMPRKTKKGAEAHKQILGFKWFLSVTETERLKFHNAPAKSPKEFEEFLPYAMVLEVEKEWADQFKDMYVTPPEWYEGRPGTAFGAWYLASSLGLMSSNINSAMVTAPRGTSTAGFGGSGFGGGGFSGGGFGGGGGGSW